MFVFSFPDCCVLLDKKFSKLTHTDICTYLQSAKSRYMRFKHSFVFFKAINFALVVCA